MSLGDVLILAGALLLVFSIMRTTSLRRRKQKLEEKEGRARKKP